MAPSVASALPRSLFAIAAKIRARAEGGLPRAGQDTDAVSGIAFQPVDGGRKGSGHLGRYGIALGGPVQHQVSDAPMPGEQHRIVRRALLPACHRDTWLPCPGVKAAGWVLPSCVRADLYVRTLVWIC